MTDHFLYAFAFSDDVVKVGRTQHLRPRFRIHRLDAIRRGADFVRGWTSNPHTYNDVCEAERVLKRMCARQWLLARGTEYFICPNFDELVEIAADLNEALLLRSGRADHLRIDLPPAA